MVSFQGVINRELQQKSQIDVKVKTSSEGKRPYRNGKLID